MHNPRRADGRKTGAPSRFSYSGAVRPTADAPRDSFLTRSRSFCAICRRYDFAHPQLQRADECARPLIYAWRPLLSMHISSRSSRQPVLRPAAMQNPRRSRAEKTGGPCPKKGVRYSPPTKNREGTLSVAPGPGGRGRRHPPISHIAYAIRVRGYVMR